MLVELIQVGALLGDRLLQASEPRKFELVTVLGGDFGNEVGGR